MIGKNHLIFAAATGLTVSIAYGDYVPANYIITISASLVGGLLPDIDNPKSIIGRILKPFSYLMNKIFGHRTFSHSFLFVGIVFFLINQFCNFWGTRYLLLGMTSGLLGHLFLDMLTRRGVPLFYPLSRKCISFCNGKSGGKYEGVKLGFAIFIVCGMIFFLSNK